MDTNRSNWSALGALLVAATSCAQTQPGSVVVTSDAVEFPAVVAADDFGDGGMAGYHLVVWSDGSAADHALFRALVTDVQVIDALEGLGARPGDALGIDSWDEREDPDAEAPQRTIEGPRIAIEVVAPGAADPLPLEAFLEDRGERGFDMRFGGHRANIDAWHSGCVVCLYSCPGSKVGNARYTVRDFVTAQTHFGVRPGILPADGTQVTVRLRLLAENVE